MMVDTSLSQALANTPIDEGQSLLDLSQEQRLLVVFLRHFQCIFCIDTLQALRKQMDRIQKAGARLVLIHMDSPEAASRYLARHKMEGVIAVEDKEKRLFRAFGLGRTTLLGTFGPRTMFRGMLLTVSGKIPGPYAGDKFQLPGAFLVHQGRILAGYRHKTISDLPNFAAIAEEDPRYRLPDEPQSAVSAPSGSPS